ncbi:MAG: hypothetical protein AB7O57_13760, partial [Hyphomicrobiaceae bacterium]
MAGSNGSPVHRGGQPPQPWPPESDEQARALEYERWQQQQAHARGYAPPQAANWPPQAPQDHAQHQQPHFDAGHPAQPYTHVHGGDPHAHQGYPHAPASAQQDYAAAAGHPRVADPFAPQFERFVPPGSRAAYDPFAPHQQAGGFAQPPPPHELHAGHDPHQLAMHDPRHAYPGHQPSAGYIPPGFGPLEHDPQHAPPAQARGDVQSWDLSQYQPGQIPQGYAGQEPAHGHQDYGAAQPGWPPNHQGQDPHWQQQPHGQPPHGHQQWAVDAHGQPVHGYATGAPGHYAGGPHDPQLDMRGGGHDAAYDGEDLEPPAPARKGPGTLMIVGALVGAIVIGGGLAVVYKQIAGGGAPKAKVAEIKRPTTAEKVRPTDPGGKTIEHSDKKFLNRLADGGSESSSRQADVDGPAKKVSTIPIVVNRDGTLSPQTSVVAPAAQPGSGVPGLVIDGFGPPPGPASAPQAPLRSEASPAQQPTTVSRLPPPPPPPPPPVGRAPPARIADLPLPPVQSAPVAPLASERAAAQVPLRKRTASARDDLLAPRGDGAVTSDVAPSGLGSSAQAAPPRKPAPAKSSSGYVAVLASKKSRQDALNSFADLHSQYPDILAGLTPDVREANLGEKGLWYRLIVGPPGSR